MFECKLLNTPTDLTTNELAVYIYRGNVDRCFYDNNTKPYFNIHQIYEIKKELGEMSEAHKKNKSYIGSGRNYDWNSLSTQDYMRKFSEKVKDTYQDELADVVIRVLDLSGYKNLSLNDIDFNVPLSTDEKDARINDNPYELSKRLFEIDRLVDTVYIHYNDAVLLTNTINNILTACNRLAKDLVIDLEWHIAAKLNFNKRRLPYHGKKY